MQADTGQGATGDAPALPPKYTPPVPVSTGSPGLPSPGLPSASDPGMVYVQPASAASPTLSSTIQQALLNDPNYKQQVEWNSEDKALQLKRLEEDKAFWDKDYQLALQQIQSSGGGGSSGEAQAAALDALAKEQAAHTKKLSEEQLREVMASRGLASSGQVGFEQGELKYNYENLLKEIDLRAAARRAAAASANAANSRAKANQIANLQLSREKAMMQFQRNAEDITSGAARNAGKILMSSGEQLAAAWWDQSTGEYQGPGGERWDKFGNPVGTAAAASAVTYTPPAPSSSPAADSLYAVSNIKNMGF